MTDPTPPSCPDDHLHASAGGASSIGYRFAEFRVDTVQRRLYRGDVPVDLSSRAFDLLLVFLRHPNALLSRDDLREAVWPARAVADSSLTHTVFLLRKALADDRRDRRFIVTDRSRGYRFVREVRPEESLEDLLRDRADREAGAFTLDRDRPAARVLAAGLFVLAGLLAFTSREAGRPADAGRSLPYSSIGVVPFVEPDGGGPSTLGVDLADAVADRLESELADVEVRRVPPVADSTSGPKRLQQIGRTLGVEALIHGTVVRSDDEVHVSARLTSTRSGRTLWGASFDGEATRMPELKWSLATGAVRAFSVDGGMLAGSPNGSRRHRSDRPGRFGYPAASGGEGRPTSSVRL